MRLAGECQPAFPLPGLGLLPAVEPEIQGLAPEQLLADLQLVMDGAYNPNHPGAWPTWIPRPWRPPSQPI